LAKFFIDRPIFAWVVALLIAMAGVLAIRGLPVAQYPQVAPPQIAVTANYPGASAEVLEDSVTSVIEQQLNGIDNLLYITSKSSSSGAATIELYFEPGTDPDIAQVQVQNKAQLAVPQLPIQVQQQGLSVRKSARNFLMIFALSSTDGSMDEIALGNYVTASVLDPIRRAYGVGEATLFGTTYAMRVWLKPDRLRQFSISPDEVSAAISAQNAQVALGQLGARPAVEGQELNVILQGRSTLSTPAEFSNILLRVMPDGSSVRLGDVAEVKLGGEDYAIQARINGKPAAGVAVKLAPGANALECTEAVRAELERLSAFFPPNTRVTYPLDASAFVRISIEEVIKTLLEAVVLVFLVMYIFLQNVRATFIPTIVVPIALLGTFGFLYAFGFSINVLTMFGMVLAIGILVDDAIVVVENVERIMAEEGLAPREATQKAMREVSGALVGITLVLVAVFLPMAFFGGSVGIIYQQFSVTMVCSLSLSMFLALSLTPALCATMLKPVAHGSQRRGLFGMFNRMFSAGTHKYERSVQHIVARPWRYGLVFAAISGVLALVYLRLPSSFLPEEDQGYFLTQVSLPEGGTHAYTLETLERVEKFYLEQPEVESLITVAGFSYNGRAQNSAFSFIRLKDWEEREGEEHSVDALVARARKAFFGLKNALVFPMNVPAIRELGTASGFDYQLQDVAGRGHAALLAARDQLVKLASQDPRIGSIRVQGLEDTAQLKLEVDDVRAAALDLNLAELNSALATAFGSRYVNNFVNGNRVQRVIVQVDAPYRMLPDDLLAFEVKNRSGRMVPLSAFARLEWGYGSPQLERYNGVPSVNLVGSAAPGRSTGEAMAAMEELSAKLPQGVGYQWTGTSYQEKVSGGQAPLLYSLSLLVVFLVLAALYESWSIPVSVLLIVPLGAFGVALASLLTGMSNDVYFKVGLLTTVGLSAKNAILIIEFARDLEAQGKELIAATLEAVRLRLRPILMTSFAFILGVMPLAVSRGAGSASQNAIGIGVAGGMLAATVLGIFFVPLFYVVVRKLTGGRPRTGAEPIEEPREAEADEEITDRAARSSLPGGAHA
jgi:hydrophobe/amphiphile efflux-1 (HAE1) family protein